MKKLLAMMLAGVMAFGMTTTAFAETPIKTIGGTDSAEVKATYQEGEAAGTVYSVSISWGSMEFTYTEGSKGTWSATEHTYTDATEGGWSCNPDANKTTVTNDSNAAVNAELSYASASDAYNDIKGTFQGEQNATIENNTLELATAVGTEKGNGPSASAYLILSGDLDENVTAGTTIGSVTVTLKAGN